MNYFIKIICVNSVSVKFRFHKLCFHKLCFYKLCFHKVSFHPIIYPPLAKSQNASPTWFWCCLKIVGHLLIQNCFIMNLLANIQKLKAEQFVEVEKGSAEYLSQLKGLSRPESVKKRMIRIPAPAEGEESPVTSEFLAELQSEKDELLGRIIGYQGSKEGRCRFVPGYWDEAGKFVQSGNKILYARSKGSFSPQGEWVVEKTTGPARISVVHPGDLSPVIQEDGSASSEYFFVTEREERVVIEAGFDPSLLYCSSDTELKGRKRLTEERVQEELDKVAVQEVRLNFQSKSLEVLIQKAKYAALTNSSPEDVEAAIEAAADL